MTEQSFTLNLIPYGIKPVIHVSQYDKGQTWIFSLKFGQDYFQIPAGSEVVIQGTLEDGSTFSEDCTFSGHTVTAIEKESMTRLTGDVSAELRIIKDNDSIGSLNFVIRVEKAALSER